MGRNTFQSLCNWFRSKVHCPQKCHECLKIGSQCNKILKIYGYNWTFLKYWGVNLTPCATLTEALITIRAPQVKARWLHKYLSTTFVLLELYVIKPLFKYTRLLTFCATLLASFSSAFVTFSTTFGSFRLRVFTHIPEFLNLVKTDVNCELVKFDEKIFCFHFSVLFVLIFSCGTILSEEFTKPFTPEIKYWNWASLFCCLLSKGSHRFKRNDSVYNFSFSQVSCVLAFENWICRRWIVVALVRDVINVNLRKLRKILNENEVLHAWCTSVAFRQSMSITKTKVYIAHNDLWKKVDQEEFKDFGQKHFPRKSDFNVYSNHVHTLKWLPNTPWHNGAFWLPMFTLPKRQEIKNHENLLR